MLVGRSPVALALLVACGPVAAEFGLAPPVVLVHDAAPAAYAIGDVDGDGRPDLAMLVRRQAPDGMRLKFEIHFRQADGGFVAMDAGDAGTPPEGDRQVLALGDMDGDGDLDAIVQAGGLYPLLWFTNHGSFFGAMGIDWDWPVDGFHFTHADGDGKTDIVVHGGQYAEVIHGNGQGGVLAFSTVFLQDTTDTLHFADITGDGGPDLVYATPDGAVRMHPREASGFSSTIRTLLSTRSEASPPSLQLADFNGDGRTDLLVDGRGWSTGTHFNVFLQDANGGFAARNARVARDDAGDILATDMDMDGIVDLLTRYQGGDPRVSLMLGRGDGTFAPPLVAPLAIISEPRPAPWDVDGDGRRDLVGARDGAIRVQYATSEADGPDFAPALELFPGGAVIRVSNRGNRMGNPALRVGLRARSGSLRQGAMPSECLANHDDGIAIDLHCSFQGLAPGATAEVVVPYGVQDQPNIVTGIVELAPGTEDADSGNDRVRAVLVIEATLSETATPRPAKSAGR